MNYADIKYPDIANGLGVRVSLFVSGCTHHCKGCFNTETWDFSYGKRFDSNAKKIIYETLCKPYVKGLSVLGGEPFDNKYCVLEFLYNVKRLFPKKDIWIYSGYTFEQIIENKYSRQLLALTDVLVDGEFVLERKNVNLRFRGSDNQRVIDVKKSLKRGSVVLYDLGE